MIKIENIDVVLPGFRLENICLEIRKNDFFAIIGPTGSGKSLLLEAITGLMPVDRGQIVLDGIDITDYPVEKRNIALVYQDFALFPHLTVQQNILYGTRYHHISEKEAAERLNSLVSTLGLDRIVHRKTGSLSGGEKQRIALARALILNPEVLLLDEPLSALDPVFHEEAKYLLKEIHDKFDITIVMVSHSFPDVLFLGSRGAVIREGRIVQKGLISDIFEKPSSVFTAGFVGMNNIFPLFRSEGRYFIKGGTSKFEIILEQVPGENHTYAGIRPEDISIAETSGEKFENMFEGVVKNISSYGIYARISVKTEEQMIFDIILPRSYMKKNILNEGDRLSFGFPPDAVRTFSDSY